MNVYYDDKRSYTKYQAAVQFVALCYCSLKSVKSVQNSVRRVARAANFCTVALNTCWYSLLKLLHVTFMAPKLLENLWTPAIGYK
jgi:hypothetical protein